MSTFAATAKSLQSCLTLRLHRRQPTRLPHPWDSPGKNTGVGCHFQPQLLPLGNLMRSVSFGPCICGRDGETSKKNEF